MGNDRPEKESSYLPRSWGNASRHPDRGVEDEFHSVRDNPASNENGANGPHDRIDASEKKSVCPCDAEVDTHEYDNDKRIEIERCDRLETLRETTAEDADGVREPSESEQSPSTLTVRVAGIRFGYACKIYNFDAGDLELSAGEWAIVKTEKGVGLGQVAIAPVTKVVSQAQSDALRRIIRKAGKVDFDQRAKCSQRETEAFAYCEERIDALGLPMKLVAVECFFDGSKYVFYFTAEGRIDFRELVKQLVARFPVRIEMRQIGVRHEAKMIGGLACCGQELCCSRFLTDFRPVSVKMAKNQNLSLNPTKISGVCGRLMCCLAYEHDSYEQFNKGLPKVGKSIRTSRGDAVVLKLNPLTETVCVRFADETVAEITKEEILFEHASPSKKSGKDKSAAKRNRTSQSKGSKDQSTPRGS